MQWLLAFDRRVFTALYAHPGGALAAAVASGLLRISTGGACWLAVFALLFAGGGRRGRRLALTGAFAVILAHAAAVWGLPGLVQRPGPFQVYPGVTLLTRMAAPFSFPAGRTAQAVAAAPFLTRGGGAGATVIWALAAAIAYAGVYTGASFPTDVAGGALVGLACAGGAVWLLGDPFRRRAGVLLPLPRRMRRPGRGPARAPGPR